MLVPLGSHSLDNSAVIWWCCVALALVSSSSPVVQQFSTSWCYRYVVLVGRSAAPKQHGSYLEAIWNWSLNLLMAMQDSACVLFECT